MQVFITWAIYSIFGDIIWKGKINPCWKICITHSKFIANKDWINMENIVTTVIYKSEAIFNISSQALTF